MKTAFYANVDGHDIVLGFSEAIPDPMATAALVGPLLLASDEAQAIARVNAGLDALRLRMYRETPPGSPYSPALMEQYESLGASLDGLGVALDAKRAQLMAENTVYCSPGPKNALVEEDQYEKYKAAEKSGYVVGLDGVPIVDNRGAAYWTKSGGAWAQTLVTCIGVEIPSGAVLQADLTDGQRAEIAEQFEAERVAGLSDEQRQAEAVAVQAQAKAAVVQVAGEVGAGISEAKALDAAKAVYQAALAALNKKYGTKLA